MQVNHLCDRPYCVQPAHLYTGTAQDNKDDSRIFLDPKLSLLPGLVRFPWNGRERDPLVQRLRERGAIWDVQPWEPAEQPPQLPLEEFTCPSHDFSITMQGGDCLICRICEISEWDEGMAEERGEWLLVAAFCPASQTVTPILEKTAGSKFMGESFRETSIVSKPYCPVLHWLIRDATFWTEVVMWEEHPWCRRSTGSG